MYELRGYQEQAVKWVRKECDAGTKSVCVQAPTGAGKTVMMAELLMDPQPQLLITHRRVLLDQLSAVLTKFGIDHGIRAAGHPARPSAPIQLAMVQSEHRRSHKTKKVALHRCTRIHIDEIHAVKSNQAQDIVDAHQQDGATLVGWTATPREIAHLCDKLYIAATVRELIDMGNLVQPVVYGPEMPDAERLERAKKQANGEWSANELKRFWRVETILGNVLHWYRKLNPGCPAIGFAPGVPEAQWFAEQFTREGIISASIDGNKVWVEGKQYESDSEARQAVFDGVRSGYIQTVWNRFVLREGFDMPEIGHAILATPFGNRSSYIQAVGRVLRPYNGRTQAIIQDHAGNWLRHPAIDGDDEWDMGVPERILAAVRVDEMREKKRPEPLVCPKCMVVRAMGPECPACGHRNERLSRPVRLLNGKIVQVQGPAYKPRREKRPHYSDREVWAKAYYGNKAWHPERTFRQVWTYLAMKAGWNYLPKTLPLMPMDERDWYEPVGNVPMDRLY